MKPYEKIARAYTTPDRIKALTRAIQRAVAEERDRCEAGVLKAGLAATFAAPPMHAQALSELTRDAIQAIREGKT